MDFKAIIFDFFDVIAPDFYRVWLERNGYKREGEFLEIAQAIDKGAIDLDEYYERLSRLGNTSVASLRKEFEMDTQLDMSVLELIHQLRQHYKIGLLTNSPQGLVRIILRNHNLEKYFDEIIISGEVGLVKPDKRIFELALENMKVRAPEALFIDDLEPYLDGARSIGMAGIRFKDASQLKVELKKLGIAI